MKSLIVTNTIENNLLSNNNKWYQITNDVYKAITSRLHAPEIFEIDLKYRMISRNYSLSELLRG